MIKVGITGGIASGKSYVASIFNRKYGIPVYDSDSRVKKLMIENTVLRANIIAAFGEDSFIDNTVNRERLCAILFNDKISLERMNLIIKPAVREDFENFCKTQTMPYVLQESAILVENKSYLELDKIICVISDLDTRQERALNWKDWVGYVDNSPVNDARDEEYQSCGDALEFALQKALKKIK